MREKPSDCTRCIHRQPNPEAVYGYQAYRCAALNFFVGETVMHCVKWKAAGREAA